MLIKKNDALEFEVLGHKVRFRPELSDHAAPQRIVDHVRELGQQMAKSNPSLDDGQIAVLVALRLASDQLSLEADYKNTIEKLHFTAKDALNLIEDISIR